LVVFLNTYRELSLLFISISLIKLIGLSICIALTNHILGNSNALSKFVCREGKHINCDDVLNSPAAKLVGFIEMSDVGLIYFAGGFFTLLFSFHIVDQLSIITLLLIVSIFSIPYIGFSVLYQFLVLKKICPFCMSIISVLVIECIISALNVNILNFNISNWMCLSIFFMSFFITILIWSIVKFLIINSTSGLEYKYNFLRLKRNPYIYNTIFNSEESIDMNYSEYDIILGNPNARKRYENTYTSEILKKKMLALYNSFSIE
jgi:uncharacterized membrane protein